MVWTKLPRSIAHRGVKLAADYAAFHDRFFRVQHAELQRAQKRADAAALELIAARDEFRRSFVAACISLDKLEDARELLEATAPERES